MSITALPTPPLNTDTTSVFNSRAFALLSALPTFVTEANVLQTDVNAKAGVATDKAVLTTDDRVQTGLDRTQTGLDRLQTGLDAVAAAGLDKRYLGSKSTAPTLDNQGAALATGAVYYDTTLAKVMTWTGSAWVEGISAVAGVSSVNGAVGAVTVQPTLVSATNIKTVNSTTLLGAGDLAVQPTLVSGTNIKTVNGTTLLGSGNLVLADTGSLVYLLTVTGTNAATIDVEHAFDSTYDEYIIECVNFITSTVANLHSRFKNSGSYDSTVANYTSNITQSGTNLDKIGQGGAGIGALHLFSSVTGTLAGDFSLQILKPFSSTSKSNWAGQCPNGTYSIQNTTGSGKYFGSGPITGFRFFASTGNITGTFHLYGVKKS